MIQRLQITAKQQEFNVKALYEAKSKERDKRQVREDADGGQSGFWEHGRVEEIVVSKGGLGM